MSCYKLQILLTLTIKTNPFAYNLQRTEDTVLISGLSILFVHLSEDRMTSTILSQFPTYCSTPLSSLLQTAVSYLTLYSLATHVASIYYL